MSVQQALMFINNCREKNYQEGFTLLTLADALALAKRKSIDCSPDDLRSAFHIDWKMRWLKFNPADGKH